MNTEIAGCLPPVAESVSPAARIIVNLCHALDCDTVPPGDYSGTNLQGLNGRRVEALALSDLEKLVLLAAGFKRTPQFIRKETGDLVYTNDSQIGWCVCQADATQSLNQVMGSILSTGTDTVGIRITPATNSSDTKPSRPYQKITSLDDKHLIKNKHQQIIGIYQRTSENGKPSDPYKFSKNDWIEMFIDPKPKDENGIKQGGGFVFQVDKNGDFNSYITTNGIDVRFVHDKTTVDSNSRQQVTGNIHNYTDKKIPHPVIRKFLSQDGLALFRLMKAVNKAYPGSDLTLEVQYANTKKDGLLIYAFDMEIPQKIEAQWRSQMNNKHVFSVNANTYNSEVLAPFNNAIMQRFITNLPDGD